MKILPKLLQGGSFVSYFSQYIPRLKTLLASSLKSTTSSALTSSKSKDDDDTKGKLTQKDLFTMIEKVDGLPNEMIALVTNLLNTFLLASYKGGLSESDLASTYLSNLYQVKVAILNKKKFDAAKENALKNGALAEPAITIDGKIYAQDKNGNIGKVTLELLLQGLGEIIPLTVALLGQLREFQPLLRGNQDVFDAMNNSIGYEGFEDLLKKGMATLGSNSNSMNQLDPLTELAKQGLLVLGALTPDLRIAILSGTVDTKIVSEDLKRLIKALTTYLTTLLPDRAKTWAAYKLGTTDKNKAVSTLILKNLEAQEKIKTEVDRNYGQFYNWNKDLSTLKSGSSESGSSNEPKEGFWRQVLSGKGGTDTRFTLLEGTGSMSVDAKYYGGVPGLDKDKSLQLFIADSNVGPLLTNSRAITFGDIKISLDSFNDIMVSAAGGQMVATLPKNPDGTVNLLLVLEYQNIVNQVKAKGLKEGTSEYERALGDALKDNHLDILVDANGLPNKNYFGHYLILNGVGSSKSQGMEGSLRQSFDKFDSNFITRDDDSADRLIAGLSTDKAKYDLDTKNWADAWLDVFSDQVYKGIIYIPINSNPLNGFNADNNDVKESQAYSYEKAAQAARKNNNPDQLR